MTTSEEQRMELERMLKREEMKRKMEERKLIRRIQRDETN